ncbi:MAG TPA: hypothetical protein VJJ72_02850 [Candidatus Paceibacterota bacterium]
MKQTRNILNYLGQLRVYGILDIFVFATALTASNTEIFGIILLWIGFLLHLEAEHRDELRLRISQWIALLVYIPSFIFLPTWVPLVFGFLGFLYAKKKKHKFLALISPMLRGLQSTTLAFSFNPYLIMPAFILSAARNLVGDFRDAGGDHDTKILTIPVRLGFRQNQSWAFYGHLIMVIFTTIFWFQYSFLDHSILTLIILMQVLAYPVTPRTSNPSYFNLYLKNHKI